MPNNAQPAGAPIDRAFNILDFVAGKRKAVSIAEIAAGLDLPLPTAHRLVANLEVWQLLQRAPGTKRFVVGNRLITLAGKTIGSAFRTARRHAVLENVSREIGEQCEIGLVRDNRVVYVDSVRVHASAMKGLQFDPGHDAPLHCTSTGKIYMASLSKRARQKLVEDLKLNAYTSNTITDRDTLLEVLNVTRRQGWSSSNEEYVRGVVGCAVPILSPDGVLLACLGLSVPTARVSFDELPAFIPPLKKAATLLSATILEENEEHSIEG